jgi:CheY-like chemotaxis protein
MNAATELCVEASWVLASGQAPRSQLLLDAARSMLVRRRDRKITADHRGEPIVLIDDDADIRDGISELLVDAGYEVLCFSSAVQALSHLRARPAARLVLLDLMMPEMCGWTFHRHLLEDSRLAEIPVIAISAAAEPPPAAVRLLAKPLQAEQLLAAVSEVVVERIAPETDYPAQ